MLQRLPQRRAYAGNLVLSSLACQTGTARDALERCVHRVILFVTRARSQMVNRPGMSGAVHGSFVEHGGVSGDSDLMICG